MPLSKYGGSFIPMEETEEGGKGGLRRSASVEDGEAAVRAACEEAAEEAKMRKGTPGGHYHGPLPAITEVMRDAIKEADPVEEPKFSGAFEVKQTAIDMQPAINKACHKGCHHPWEEYEKCEMRVEKKGEGECAGYYMDYLHCIDQCSSKLLFKTLV